MGSMIVKLEGWTQNTTRKILGTEIEVKLNVRPKSSLGRDSGRVAFPLYGSMCNACLEPNVALIDLVHIVKKPWINPLINTSL